MSVNDSWGWYKVLVKGIGCDWQVILAQSAAWRLFQRFYLGKQPRALLTAVSVSSVYLKGLRANDAG